MQRLKFLKKKKKKKANIFIMCGSEREAQYCRPLFIQATQLY